MDPDTVEKVKEISYDGRPLVQAVVGFLVKDDMILLGLRKKVSFGLGENLIAGIGGKIGDSSETAHETPEEALKREMEEEIGVKIILCRKVARLRFIWPHKPNWGQDVVAYIVDAWEGEPKETEAIKPMWFPKKELPQDRMWDDNAFWLPKIIVGERIYAAFVFDADSKVCQYSMDDAGF
jgi:8-oxo-dGTP diphosphatase